jgi:endonuclease YncB( thermonuclease family)
MPSSCRRWIPPDVLGIPFAGVLALLLLLAGAAVAEEITGRVVGIGDGNTLTVLTPERRQVRVRLAEIDTPERRQPYGARSREALSGMVFGNEVRVEVVVDTDRHGRTVVGRVFLGTADVGAALVRQGAAWVDRDPRYQRDAARFEMLLALEEEARSARRGLWRLPDAQRTPPWEWRAMRRSGLPPGEWRVLQEAVFRIGVRACLQPGTGICRRSGAATG